MKRLTRHLVWTWVKAVVWLWRRAPLRGGGRLVRLLALAPARGLGSTTVRADGLKVRVDVTNPPEEAILLWRSYEEDVVAAFEQYISPGNVAIDVGANAGILTLALAARVGPAGRVLAVDPSGEACDRVREQARANEFEMISTAAVALGDHAAREDYRSARVGIGMLPMVDEPHVTGPSSTVAQLTLDEIVKQETLPRVDFIKIDTDGSEVEILEGGRQMLRDHRPAMSVELNPPGLGRRGRTAGELLDLLEELGYDLFTPVFSERSRWSAKPATFERFEPLTPDRLARRDVFNLLAVPAGTAPR